jgi:hypothetical protein
MRSAIRSTSASKPVGSFRTNLSARAFSPSAFTWSGAPSVISHCETAATLRQAQGSTSSGIDGSAIDKLADRHARRSTSSGIDPGDGLMAGEGKTADWYPVEAMRVFWSVPVS